MKDKTIIITGPTASGKSDIAINIAQKINGQVISADSQQVYREMDIGTNKVVNYFEVDHHMLNLVDPNENFSVEEFKNDAKKIITVLNNNHIMPIVTGGTGFYIDSLIFDMNYGQVKKDDEIRKKFQKLAIDKGNEYLFEKLLEIDPLTARKYHPNELNRIIRALEIYEITGEKPSEKRRGEKKLNENLKPILFFLNYSNREGLYKKINERVINMVEEGLINEVKYLIDKYNLDENSQSMSAIGYKEVLTYIRGEIGLDEMVNLIQRNSRRYAKRQITWMKRYLPYPFTHEIIMDDLSKDDASMIIEDLIKDIYEF
ncbi:tRNA (adenosine(37)-N6)-dimethylallyltransferase MiaA [uncultured Anaerococcus sp.]|uniref:tRNA (adenosine(37)-N6)-dimethylallyltransferase MiaA n=1 Tax=uncultured Anaerococcus sp. TaxID=293428 RepID=UPI0025E39ED6|nr:tRNA (adenosine(37)-N6)-dimethylallyltransferase MiaA [uncultured Anaerococcus sp.]